jgi:calcineurin-like phosphoesterase family protein
MSKTFLIGDTHFGHANILTFKKQDGSLLRNFHNIWEHDEFIIECWNKVVSPIDKVYHLGDVGFKNWTSLDNILSRLNGTKILIKGNHDGHKLSQYQQYFKDIRGSHILDKCILTHIPIHPESLTRWKANLHGHVHSNSLLDKRYINLSVEVINYTPIDFEYIRTKLVDK